jgi:hypothetical protein
MNLVEFYWKILLDLGYAPPVFPFYCLMWGSISHFTFSFLLPVGDSPAQEHWFPLGFLRGLSMCSENWVFALIHFLRRLHRQASTLRRICFGPDFCRRSVQSCRRLGLQVTTERALNLYTHTSLLPLLLAFLASVLRFLSVPCVPDVRKEPLLFFSCCVLLGLAPGRSLLLPARGLLRLLPDFAQGHEA